MDSQEMQHPHYRRNLLIAASIAILIGLITLTFAVSRIQLDAFLSPRPSIPQETPEDYGLEYKEVSIMASDDTRLTAWYLPATEPNGAAMVLVHGHGGNRGSLLPTAEILGRNGYNLLLLDLRGHGQSEGEIVTYGYLESLDVLAAMNFLSDQQDIDPNRIGLLGQSLGGAAVIRAAAQSDTPRVVIVESTFSSLQAAIDDAFDDMSILPKWPFARIIIWQAERAAGVDIDEFDLVHDFQNSPPRPVFLIHGANDQLIPLEHHLALYQAARDPKQSWIVEGMGHQSPALYCPDEYERRLMNFLSNYLWRNTDEDS